MLVGRYAYHLGAQSSNLGPTNSGCAVSDKYDLIPAALKKFAPVQYATHAFGKYNLGFYAKRYARAVPWHALLYRVLSCAIGGYETMLSYTVSVVGSRPLNLSFKYLAPSLPPSVTRTHPHTSGTLA
jgi:hypothetical protein